MTVEHRNPTRRAQGLLLIGLLAISLVASGCTGRELGARSQTLINTERARNGLPELSWDDNAAAKAQAWAERLAGARSLSHSRLADGISGDWTILGENVGYAANVDAVHRSYMNSPQHRANILNGSYRQVGIGVAQGGGNWYVVQVFRG